MSVAPPPPDPAAVVGTTAAGLLDGLWAGRDIDVYVSRALDVRFFPLAPGWGDAVWLSEPPAPPTCYLRLTPGRMLGLAVRAKKRRAVLAACEKTRATMSPAERAALDEKLRLVEREAAVLKELKTEFQSRWPDALARLSQYVPEDLTDTARPSDVWYERKELAVRPAAPPPPPLTPDEADLFAWAAALAPPADPVRATPYAVVLDGAAWLGGLRVRAGAVAPDVRRAAVRRLAALRATPPPPAAPTEAAAARRLAALAAGPGDPDTVGT